MPVTLIIFKWINNQHSNVLATKRNESECRKWITKMKIQQTNTKKRGECQKFWCDNRTGFCRDLYLLGGIRQDKFYLSLFGRNLSKLTAKNLTKPNKTKIQQQSMKKGVSAAESARIYTKDRITWRRHQIINHLICNHLLAVIDE